MSNRRTLLDGTAGTALHHLGRIFLLDPMTKDQNVLTVKCPFCGWEHRDHYECLKSGRLDLLRCDSGDCRQQFSFLIRECLECGEETVFTWKSMPAPAIVALLSCNHCGAPFDEPASQGQSPDPAQRI